MKDRQRPEITAPEFIRRTGNSRRVINKFLVATTLIIAFSAPALAASGKAQIRPDQRHVESTSERQWKWANAQGRLHSRRVGDPYWTPCDYSSSYGTDSCE
jgi:hypothetical protein